MQEVLRAELTWWAYDLSSPKGWESWADCSCARLLKLRPALKQAPAFSCWVLAVRGLESRRWWSESRSGLAGKAPRCPPPACPHPGETVEWRMKGGEELTRRVCVGRAQGVGGGPAGRTACTRPRIRKALGTFQEQRGAREAPCSRRGGGGVGRKRQVPARKLRPVCAPVPRVFVSVIFPGLCGALLASFLCPLLLCLPQSSF